jgi:hypothetical protein
MFSCDLLFALSLRDPRAPHRCKPHTLIHCPCEVIQSTLYAGGPHILVCVMVSGFFLKDVADELSQVVIALNREHLG